MNGETLHVFVGGGLRSRAVLVGAQGWPRLREDTAPHLALQFPAALSTSLPSAKPTQSALPPCRNRSLLPPTVGLRAGWWGSLTPNKRRPRLLKEYLPVFPVFPNFLPPFRTQVSNLGPLYPPHTPAAARRSGPVSCLEPAGVRPHSGIKSQRQDSRPGLLDSLEVLLTILTG